MGSLDDGWIKLHRRLLSWEWADDPNTLALFIHLLLSANWTDSSYRGTPVKRGQLVTSLPKLAAQTGLTIRQTRTALSRLKATDTVTDESSRKGRIITVVSFDKYQGSGRQSDRQTTDKRQTERQANSTLNKNNTKNTLKKGKKATSAGGLTAALRPEDEHGDPLPDDYWDD